MTATTDLRLDFPAHSRMPADEPGQWEFFLEQLIRHHIDSGAAWPLTMIHRHRPDLTPEQVDELIHELCALNDAVADAALTGQQRTYEHAVDTYSVALMRLATRPDDLTAIVDAINEDELARKRGDRK